MKKLIIALILGIIFILSIITLSLFTGNPISAQGGYAYGADLNYSSTAGGNRFESVDAIRQYVRSLPSYEWYYSWKPIYYTNSANETYEIPRDKLCRYIVGDRIRQAEKDNYFMGVLWTYSRSGYSHWENFTFTKDGRVFKITLICNLSWQEVE